MTQQKGTEKGIQRECEYTKITPSPKELGSGRAITEEAGNRATRLQVNAGKKERRGALLALRAVASRDKTGPSLPIAKQVKRAARGDWGVAQSPWLGTCAVPRARASDADPCGRFAHPRRYPKRLPPMSLRFSSSRLLPGFPTQCVFRKTCLLVLWDHGYHTGPTKPAYTNECSVKSAQGKVYGESFAIRQAENLYSARRATTTIYLRSAYDERSLCSACRSHTVPSQLEMEAPRQGNVEKKRDKHTSRF